MSAGERGDATLVAIGVFLLLLVAALLTVCVIGSSHQADLDRACVQQGGTPHWTGLCLAPGAVLNN